MDKTVQPSTAKAGLHSKQYGTAEQLVVHLEGDPNQNNRDSKQDLESARGHDTKSLQRIQVGKTASHGFVAASTISGVTCFMQR